MTSLLKIFILVTFLANYDVNSIPVSTDSEKIVNKCGYESCHPTKEGHVNVHLISHSHDDVGWTKTMDQYYYGTNGFTYNAGVQYIYDNVLQAVKSKKDRKFIFVETAFFWQWWQEQTQNTRNDLQELVNNGQIEFAGGGWSMNDEAVTHYHSTIDQMTWGLRILNDTLGDCARPKIGWQIDSFGHSNEMASIFAQLGLDGVILGRIDYQDKKNRLEKKSMDLVWQASNNLGDSSNIFTSVLFNHYDAPEGFCFDILCNVDPLVDNPKSPEYNIDERAKEFILKSVKDAVDSYETSNIMIPMGRNFAYQEAEVWFKNIDKLIKHINNKIVNNGTKYHLLYSTPSCYAAAVHKESQGVLTSSVKTDDFFPYATDKHSYWTGFYTSRPTLKRYERMGNNFLQICKQLYALSNMTFKYDKQLNALREAMGVMQHHDAVTGTEKEVVAYDYARLLDLGFKNCEIITDKAISKLSKVDHSTFNTCLLTNVSQCEYSEKSDNFVVTVYNPLSRPVTKYVRLPVFGDSYTVMDSVGDFLKTQILPIAKGVLRIPGRKSNATQELMFAANEVPPLGFKSFYIEKNTNENDDMTFEEYTNQLFINNSNIGLEIDSHGLVKKIRMNDVSFALNHTFLYYNGSNGLTSIEERESGAYIFRPDRINPIEHVTDRTSYKIYKGNLVQEIHQIFNDWITQVIRVYEGENFVEFDWVVGPLMIETIHGKEVISRFTTELRTDATFYTDSNGRELMKRIRNFRPSWRMEVVEKESSNYYPVTSKIVIRDEVENIEFAVLIDRAAGGSSLKDGEVELMVHRNSVYDDQLGVNEPLRDMAFDQPIVVRGSHYVVAGKIKNGDCGIAASEREIADRKLLDSWVFFSSTNGLSFDEYQENYIMEFSGLKRSLPKNVHILTLEPWKESSLLLRLEHIFEKDEDPIFSAPVTVNIKDLFTTFEIKSLQETTLGANKWLKDNRRLQFRSVTSHKNKKDPTWSSKISENDYEITLTPMQIRTFIVNIDLNINTGIKL